MMQKTFMNFLIEKDQAKLIQLRVQYRMNRDIMYLANTLFYKGKLLCSSKDIENNYITFEKQLENRPETWINKVIKKNSAVVFVDSDQITEVEPIENLFLDFLNEFISKTIYNFLIGLGLKEETILVLTSTNLSW